MKKTGIAPIVLWHQKEQVKYSSKSVEIRLKRTQHQCPHRGSTAVSVEPLRRRRIRGEPLGSCCNVVLEFTIHRLYCHSCHHREQEHIPFLSHPKSPLDESLGTNDSYHVRIAFYRWGKMAEETGIPELKTMARTIRDKLEGIVTYWTFRHISNAKMEGFNNKIRWLIKPTYGSSDREYFKLKIYQLPEISSEKSL